MFIGRIVGNMVSSVKIDDYQGHKLLMVQPLTPDGELWKKKLIAVDLVGAGTGETVLYIDEGNSARQLLDLDVDGAVRAVIVGIVDEIRLADKTIQPHAVKKPETPEAPDWNYGL